MGYIFDALSRGPAEDDQPHAPEQGDATPVPAPEPQPELEAEALAEVTDEALPSPVDVAQTEAAFDAEIEATTEAADEATADAAPVTEPETDSTGAFDDAAPEPVATVAAATPDAWITATTADPDAQADDTTAVEAAATPETIDASDVDDIDHGPIALRHDNVIVVDDEYLGDLDDRLVTLTTPAAQTAEEYRSIRTALLAKWEQRRHLVHVITSATPQEGKTITSINLGQAFAELRNRSVIIVEADLRLPTFDKLLKVGPTQGLISYLRGESELESSIYQLGDGGLSVLPAAGRATNDAIQLLTSTRMSQLLETLRQRYDHVVIDTPPVVELADAGILGAQSDDVLLIARMNRTPRTLIEQAIRTLGSYNAPVAGMIATDHQRARHRYYYYRYGYRYRYRYYTKQAA